MAKGKKGGRRQGLFSKATNILLTALAFSRPLFLLFRPGGFSQSSVKQLIGEATFGLTDGTFSMERGLIFYSPAAASFGIGTMLKFIRKKFPVR